MYESLGSYHEKAIEVNRLMIEINSGLRNHKKKFMSDSMNYGYVGDLGHIQEMLEDVASFLNAEGSKNA